MQASASRNLCPSCFHQVESVRLLLLFSVANVLPYFASNIQEGTDTETVRPDIFVCYSVCTKGWLITLCGGGKQSSFGGSWSDEVRRTALSGGKYFFCGDNIMVIQKNNMEQNIGKKFLNINIFGKYLWIKREILQGYEKIIKCRYIWM